MYIQSREAVVKKMEVCLKIFCCGEKGETRKNAMSYILGWMIMKAPMTMIEWWLSPMKFCNAFSLMQNIKTIHENSSVEINVLNIHSALQ